MKKILMSILFSCFFLPSCTSCSSNSDGDGKKPEPEVPVDNKEKYTCIFYFSGYGDGFMSDANTAPSTGDCWIMEGQEPKFSGQGAINWWGKPFWAGVNDNGQGKIKDYYRFYFNGDPNQVNEELLNWHADLLADADIDIAVLDFTNAAADYPNGPYYISATKALCKSWQERIRKNLKTPKIVFFFNNQAALQRIEQEFFNVYDKDLFFNYLGKKFILCADPGFEKRGVDDRWDITLSPAVPTEGIYGKYTTRHCWGLLADNPKVGAGKYWTFKELMLDPLPTPFYYKGEAEQLCVTTACASYNSGTIHGIGRDGGATFQKFMDKAKQVQPKFVFIHSWNEWNAINQASNGAGHFIDQYIDTYSSDIEPMWGGHGFKYYDLMRRNLADYKDFTYCDPVSSGKTFIFIPKQSRKALSSTGSKVVQNQRIANEAAQQWEVAMVSEGIYTIKNKKTNKYLSEQEADESVIETDAATGDAQLWKFETATDGYYKITNKKSGRFLEIEASSLRNNAKVICSTVKITDDNVLWELSLIK